MSLRICWSSRIWKRKNRGEGGQLPIIRRKERKKERKKETHKSCNTKRFSNSDGRVPMK